MEQFTGQAMRIDVHDATPADAARFAEFGARTFYESFAVDNSEENMRLHLASAWSPARQLAEIRDPAVDTFILTDDAGAWLGFAQLRAGKVHESVPSEGAIELMRFYVDRPWQGRGVATELMQVVKQRARRRGATTLWLGVWENNPRAQAFYRKHGFATVGSQVFVVGTDPQSDHVMMCSL